MPSIALHMAINMVLACLKVAPLVKSARLDAELSHPLMSSVRNPAAPVAAAPSLAYPLPPLPTEKDQPLVTPWLDRIDGRRLRTLFASFLAWVLVAEHDVIGLEPWCRFQYMRG